MKTIGFLMFFNGKQENVLYTTIRARPPRGEDPFGDPLKDLGGLRGAHLLEDPLKDPPKEGIPLSVS